METYKIYKKGSILRIERIDRRQIWSGLTSDVLIDKNNLGKPIYRFFNVKDWADRWGISISQLFKEDGSPYTEVEFDFFIENTGFNGGGTAPNDVWQAQVYENRTAVIYENKLYILASSVTLPFNSTDFATELVSGSWVEVIPDENNIPLTGTTEGNPVTGDIELDDKVSIYSGIPLHQLGNDEFNVTGFRRNEEGKEVFIGVDNGNNRLVGIEFTDNNNFKKFLIGETTISNNGEYTTSDLSAEGFRISSTNPLFKGFYTLDDFSEKDPENKQIYAQRSYVEKPETLITALNNCDSTQLDEIKTILGII